MLWEEANNVESKLIHTKDTIIQIIQIELYLRCESIYFQDEFASEDNRGNLF